MNKKTIRIFCFGPVALSPEYESPWEDAWLRYKVKRKVIQEGPCFIGRQALDADIWLERKMLKEYPDRRNNEQYGLDFLISVANLLDSGEGFFSDNWTSRLPNIYLNSPFLCRKNIEDATVWYLRQKGVLKSEARFRWNKPETIALPTFIDAKNGR